MQVQIKFTRQGGSPMTGEFSPGDTLRCDPALAKHLVDQAKCAKYMPAAEKKPALTRTRKSH